MNALIKNKVQNTKNVNRYKIFFTVTLAFILICSFSSYNAEKNWVIVIDAGHGGKDPGAIGTTNSREKNITLAVALKTGEYIEKNLENVTVIYTRKTDVFVELQERAAIANKNHADLFISIHANAVGANARNIQGAETFIMGLTRDKENIEVAMKENQVILLESDYSTKYEGFDPTSPESYIMFSLMQNIYQQQSINLASKIQDQFKNRVNRIDRGVKQAGFLVLYMTTMPSVLIELGFITHPAEERFLTSTEGQDYLASAIFRACREYINEIDRRSGISTVREEEKTAATTTTTTSTNTLTTVATNTPAAEIPTTDEIIFRVQIVSATSKIDMRPANFRGIDDLYEIAENNRFKYATGQFASYTEAVEFRKKIDKTYPDAFVIAIKNNKTIPLQQAIEQMRK